MHKFTGGCDCGNLSYEMALTVDPASINPRACDCDFCVKHGAAYFSDAEGSLRINVKHKTGLSEYRQGSGMAKFLICKQCGVLLGGCYEVGNQRYAAINSRTVDRPARFGKDVVASPKVLPDDEKTQRWRKLWFSNVDVSFDKT
ncbi:MAG: aldehyde-activating protein [Sedimenticola sp.]|nr:aldehyde-activating protein [Sedimenticola sp.]